MISCTEFIPAYSEMFAFLDERFGRDEIDRMWADLFKPSGKGSPLINFVSAEGIRGCYTYWSGTLNEEAADFTMYLNEKSGWFMLKMHKCPSKGKLIELEKKIGLKPYRDYCLHCDQYRLAIEKVGLKYIYNFSGMDRAACEIFIYDPKIFDGRIIINSDTLVMDRRASDNEYFHPSFHSSMSRCVDYVGRVHGESVLRDYFEYYVKNLYKSMQSEFSENPLCTIEKIIRRSYESEKALDALTTKNDGKTLTVSTAYCPAVKYMTEAGKPISEWFLPSKEMYKSALAKLAGVKFVMESCDKNSGAYSCRFEI